MNFQLWNIFRGDLYIGSVRSLNAATACKDYTDWAKCNSDGLRAVAATGNHGAAPRKAFEQRY